MIEMHAINLRILKLYGPRTKIAKRFLNKVSRSDWQTVIGLEVHAQISSKSKLFSDASTVFSSPVNTNVSLFDCSIPGTLPVLNRRCVEAGVLTALALRCSISLISMFDRKHYFYSDLPEGYQITQQRSPLAKDGELDFEVFVPTVHKTPYKKKTRLKQLQLEQDSGKSLHDTNRSLIDLNRAGMPLMELVFEPDLTDGEEAAALIKELVIILQRIGTCSCKMEEGALRVDANVSIHKEGEPLGTRTEIKNIGSIRGVANAIKYEIQRQINLKESGLSVINETRAWDTISKSTVSMRDKEEKQDYRYMPEPNLPPLHIATGPIKFGVVNAEELKATLPELPDDTRLRLREKMGLKAEQAIILVNNECLLNIFENVLRNNSKIQSKLLANVIINEFTTILNEHDKNSSELEVNDIYFATAVEMLQDGKINRHSLNYLFTEFVKGNKTDPKTLIEEKGLMMITDVNILRKFCQEVIDENGQLVESYKKGKKTQACKKLISEVYRKYGKKADMAKVDMLMRDLLKNL